jgi:membrane-bound lytic murein transglycosylase D
MDNQNTGTNENFVYHVVTSGDTVWEIAQKYNVSVNEILKWNNLSRTSRIQPGQKLKVAKKS